MHAILIGLTVGFAALCAMAPPSAFAATLTVGSVTTEAVREYRTFKPLIRYLVDRLGEDGITRGKLVTARDSLEMSWHLRDGEADIFFENALVAWNVSQSSGAVLFLQQLQDGHTTYRSVIFTRADSTVRGIADLLGRKIAFRGADSTTGYIVPRLLIEHGELRLTGLESFRSPAPENRVGFVFSGSDENTLYQVMAEHVAAGAMAAPDMARMAPAGAVRIIAMSEPLPDRVFGHRRGLSPALVARIRDVLTSMDESAEGRGVLEGLGRAARFEDLSEEVLAQIKAVANGHVKPATMP